MSVGAPLATVTFTRPSVEGSLGVSRESWTSLSRSLTDADTGYRMLKIPPPMPCP